MLLYKFYPQLSFFQSKFFCVELYLDDTFSGLSRKENVCMVPNVAHDMHKINTQTHLIVITVNRTDTYTQTHTQTPIHT